MRRILPFFVVAALAMMAVPLHAAGTDSGGGYSASDLIDARKALEAGNFAAAEKLLSKTLTDKPKNADAWNLLGYAARKQGKRDAAEAHYAKALTLDPKHTGALNYLGMLYIQTGRMDKAKEMLQRLDGACFFPCTDYEGLKQAVETGKVD